MKDTFRSVQKNYCRWVDGDMEPNASRDIGARKGAHLASDRCGPNAAGPDTPILVVVVWWSVEMRSNS